MPSGPREIHLLSTVTFHHREARLPLLRRVLAEQPSLGQTVKVQVFTDASGPAELAAVEACLPPRTPTFQGEVVRVPPQAHPYFLTWAHKQALRGEFMQTPGYTHFLYVEDDLLMTRRNLDYWVAEREALRPEGLLPAFFRVERRDATGDWMSSDLVLPILLWRGRSLRRTRRRWYLGLLYPYQAMYLFDRALAEEHLAGPAMNPDFGIWNIRERAAQGQTLVDVPPGFRARTVVPFDPVAQRILPECQVHHLPNTYANDPGSPLGKVRLDRIVARPTMARLYAAVARLDPARG